MYKWEFFQDASGGWRWRRVSTDGAAVTANRSFPSRDAAQNSARVLGFRDDPAQPGAPRRAERDETTDSAGRGDRWSGYNPYDTGTTDPERKR